jgi:hypothetical protein
MAAPLSRSLLRLILLLTLAFGHGASAEPASFGAAVEQASMQYRSIMDMLETGGRDETAAEVEYFRAAWGDIIERFGKDRPAAFAGDDTYSSTLMEIDVRLLGAMLVINIGSREAAREALKPIGEAIARLQQRGTSPP